MTVLVPSRFWMVSSGGRAVGMGSLSSSSSAQSLWRRSEGCQKYGLFLFLFLVCGMWYE